MIEILMLMFKWYLIGSAVSGVIYIIHRFFLLESWEGSDPMNTLAVFVFMLFFSWLSLPMVIAFTYLFVGPQGGSMDWPWYRWKAQLRWWKK